MTLPQEKHRMGMIMLAERSRSGVGAGYVVVVVDRKRVAAAVIKSWCGPCPRRSRKKFDM